MATYHKDSESTVKRINKAYDKAIKDINKDIDRVFYNYKTKSNLSGSEAKELLNSKVTKKELDNIREGINSIQDKEIKRHMSAQLNEIGRASRRERV